jgi:hypothetical protein
MYAGEVAAADIQAGAGRNPAAAKITDLTPADVPPSSEIDHGHTGGVGHQPHAVHDDGRNERQGRDADAGNRQPIGGQGAHRETCIGERERPPQSDPNDHLSPIGARPPGHEVPDL